MNSIGQLTALIMIKALRKKHLQIWTLWSMLIPLGIVSAVLVRPAFPKDKLLQPASAVALPVVLKSFNKENYTINIRGNSDSSQVQLEWINKKTLTYPTATIYEDTANVNDISKAILIGRIEARGIYHFQLKKSLDNKYHFIIYDFIHQQIIDSITF
jgi:hypothetical protein